MSLGFVIHKDVGKDLRPQKPSGTALCTLGKIGINDSSAHAWVEVTCEECLKHKPSWEKAMDDARNRLFSQPPRGGKGAEEGSLKQLWEDIKEAVIDSFEGSGTSFSAVMKLAGLIVAGVMAFGLVWLVVMSLFWAVIVVFCWNGVVASVFGLSTLSYWQAYGLTLLCRILIRSGSSSNINWGGNKS